LNDFVVLLIDIRPPFQVILINMVAQLRIQVIIQMIVRIYQSRESQAILKIDIAFYRIILIGRKDLFYFIPMNKNAPEISVHQL
jgi:hypothetical protein